MEGQLPALRNISSINQFEEIKKVAQWPLERLTTFYNGSCALRSTMRQQIHRSCLRTEQMHQQQNSRRNITQMLRNNRREFHESTHHNRELMNMSFIKMVRLTNDVMRKGEQHKIKNKKRLRKAETYHELIALPSQVKCTQANVQPEKIVTSFAVSFQRVDFQSTSQFFGLREGACLIGYDKHLYLCGGYAGEFDNNKSYLNVFDFVNKTWTDPKQIGDVPPMSLIGVTVEEWKGSLYFIGGMSLNLFGRKHIYPNELTVYNPERFEWSKSKILEGRRYHTSSRYMHYFIVYGGINEKEEYLGNIVILNMQTNASQAISYLLQDDTEGIAYHRIVSTMELQAKKRVDLMKDGVYCFGGKTNSGSFIEGIKVLNLEINSNNELFPKEWIKIKTEGVAPKPRINHSMTLLSRLSGLCVIGGHSDRNEVYRDVYILNLLNLNWYCPQIIFDDVFSRGLSGHTSTVQGSKIYIFGGLRSDGQYSTELLQIETDQNRVQTALYTKNRKLNSSLTISRGSAMRIL